MTKEKLEARIQIMQQRHDRENGKIVKKLQRQLRNLQKSNDK